MLENPKHPYWHVKRVIENIDDDIQAVTLSYYRYTRRCLDDDRIAITLSREEFLDEDKIEDLARETPKGMELAFHSLLKTGKGRYAHLPLVDMSTGSGAQLNKIQPFIGQTLYDSLRWYESGRAYHGYGGFLISPDEWTSLMGKLLLTNKPEFPPTVDFHWIGHRLMAGYATLRWTRNTPQYLQAPTTARLLV